MNYVPIQSKLEDTIDQWMISFFGPNKRSKFVIDDSDIFLVNCPLQLLENIKFEHPLEQVLYESLNSFHDEYGCCVNTFLLMWCGWYRAMKQLINKGILFSEVFEEINNGLEYIIDTLKSQELYLRFVIPLFYKYKRKLSAQSIQTPDHFNPDILAQNSHSARILKQSRYFSPVCRINDTSQRQIDSKVIKMKEYVPLLIDKTVEEEMSLFIKRISCDYECLVPLVLNIWKKQVENSPPSPSFRFQIDNVITKTIPNHSFHYSTVIDGIAISSELTVSQIPTSNTDTALYRTLLIGGDLTSTYNHLGFSPKTVVEKFTNTISETDDELWLQKILNLLKKLQISALLVHGKVDARITQSLQNSAMIFSPVPYSTLKLISKHTQTNIVTYMENWEEENVSSIKIIHLQSKLQNKTKLFIVDIQGQVFQTAIICHELPYIANQLEHAFWHTLNRFSNICTLEKVLLGCGKTEKWCIQQLYELIDKKKDNKYSLQREILQVLVKGFEHYINVLYQKLSIVDEDETPSIQNNGELCECIKYDDPKSKVEAWKAALKLVFLLVQVDAFIVNGTSDSLNRNLYFPVLSTCEL